MRDFDTDIYHFSTEELSSMDPTFLEMLRPEQLARFNQDQLNAIAARIVDRAIVGTDLLFIAQPLIVAPFPTRTSPDCFQYTRTYRWQRCTLTSTQEGTPIPGGIWPRLLMAHITTSVVQTKSPLVDFKNTTRELMTAMGARPVHGTHGNIDACEAAIRALPHLVVAIEDHKAAADGYRAALPKKEKGGESSLTEGLEVHGGKSHTKIIRLFDESMLTIDETGLVTGMAMVSPEFQELCQVAIPLSRETICNLARQRSPVALDIYAYATWVTYYLKTKNRPHMVLPWDIAIGLWADGLDRRSHAIREITKRLSLVKAQYQGLNYGITLKGIMFMRGEPHISRRDLEEIPNPG